MANITKELIKQYQHPRVKLIVSKVENPQTPTDNITIYEYDIDPGSFNYKGESTGGGAFAPGGCTIGSCSFTIINSDGKYSDSFREGSRVVVEIGYGPNPETATYDRLCIVYVAEISRSNYKIAVKCFDEFRKADKVKWTGYEFPMSVNQIISSAAKQSGFDSYTLPSFGGNVTVDLRDEEGNQPELDMTCRQAMAYALEISGNYGRMDNLTNYLYCGWFAKTPNAELDEDWLLNYKISDSQSYTGVQVYGQVPKGSTERLYVLSNNPFLNELNCAEVQARLYDALVGLEICTAEIQAVCNPAIYPGMVVGVTYPMAGEKKRVQLPITALTIKGSMNSTYITDSISADEMDDLRKSQTQSAEEVAKADQGVSGGLATQDWVNCRFASFGGGGSGSGSDTHGIPAGGATGQVLTKNSDTDYDATWATPSGGGSGGSGSGQELKLIFLPLLSGYADDDITGFKFDTSGIETVRFSKYKYRIESGTPIMVPWNLNRNDVPSDEVCDIPIKLTLQPDTDYVSNYNHYAGYATARVIYGFNGDDTPNYMMLSFQNQSTFIGKYDKMRSDAILYLNINWNGVYYDFETDTWTSQ